MVLTGMVNRLAEVGSGGLPHLSYDESSNLSGRVVLALSPYPSVSIGVRYDLERNVVEVLLNFGILELSSDKSAP